MGGEVGRLRASRSSFTLARHPQALNAAAMEDIRELIHEAPSLFLDEIAEWLAIYHEQPISTTVLHDNLCKLGLTYKKLRKVAAERDDAVQHGCTKSAPTIWLIKWSFSTN